jgi:hypothetical protein
MRDIFPAHFRPSSEDLDEMWKTATFAVDANVLLNLYRYSSATRQELEQALESVKKQLFLPHQAAREFLKNRLSVTSEQSERYTSIISDLSDIIKKIKNKKRHPFVSDKTLSEFENHTNELMKELERGRDNLLKRLIYDERLEYIDSLFKEHTGEGFSEKELEELSKKGNERYSKKIPPGYMDKAKNSESDPYRKYGDLILWKQLIKHAKTTILITDDGKEDWWLKQPGRTIGPRVELREEFLKETGKNFWMYGVDLFLKQSAKRRNETVSKEIISEVVEVSTEYSQKRGDLEYNRISSKLEEIVHSSDMPDNLKGHVLSSLMLEATSIKNSIKDKKERILFDRLIEQILKNKMKSMPSISP